MSRAVAAALGALALASALGAAGPDGVALRYRPTPALAYRLADLEKVERQVRAGAAAPLPKPEVHTYRTDKRYRWQVALRKGGLVVKLDVVSSRMQMDGTTVPRDLGGHSGEDWIDDRGNVERLGPVEDPIRPEAPFPSLAVKPGDSWAEKARAADAPVPVTYDVRFIDVRTVAGVPCVHLEASAEGDAVDAKRNARVVLRSKADVDIDSARGVVVAADAKVRMEETMPATGETLSRVVRVTRRKVVLEGAAR